METITNALHRYAERLRDDKKPPFWMSLQWGILFQDLALVGFFLHCIWNLISGYWACYWAWVDSNVYAWWATAILAGVCDFVIIFYLIAHNHPDVTTEDDVCGLGQLAALVRLVWACALYGIFSSNLIDTLQRVALFSAFLVNHAYSVDYCIYALNKNTRTRYEVARMANIALVKRSFILSAVKGLFYASYFYKNEYWVLFWAVVLARIGSAVFHWIWYCEYTTQPKFDVGNECDISNEHQECYNCAEQMEPSERYPVTLPCGHVTCAACIRRYIMVKIRDTLFTSQQELDTFPVCCFLCRTMQPRRPVVFFRQAGVLNFWPL